MARNDGSMSIAVTANTSEFQKSINRLQNEARTEGRKIAEALGSQFDKPLRDAMTTINRNWKTAVESIKMTEVKIDTASIENMSKELGIAADTYNNLAERIAQNNALKTAEDSFRRIAEQAKLSAKEMRDLGKEMGFTENQLNKLANDMRDAERQMERVAKQDPFAKLKGIATTVISLGVLREAVQLYGDSIDRIVKMGEMASGLGIAVEDFAKISDIAKQSGVDIDNFRDSWNELSKAIADAEMGDKNKFAAFKQLGIDIKEFKTLNPTEQLRTLADAVANIGDQGQKARLTSLLFGEDGSKSLMPLLQQGADGVDKLADRFDKMGRNISGLDVQKAKEAQIAIANLRDAWGNLADSLILKISPAVVAVLNRISDAIAGAQALAQLIDQMSDTSKTRKLVKDFDAVYNEVLRLEAILKNPPTDNPYFDAAKVTANLQEAKAEAHRLNDIIQSGANYTTYSKLAENLIKAKTAANSAASAIVDFSDIIKTLQGEIAQINAGDDPFAQWKIEYNNFAEQVKGSKIATGLLDELDTLTQQQILLNEAKKEQKNLDEEIKRLADEEKAKADAINDALNTRMGIWQELGFESVQAMEDLDATLEQYRQGLVDARLNEEDLAEAIRLRREELLNANKSDTGWVDGMKSAFDKYVEEAGNASKNAEDFFNKGIDGMEDALTDFVTKGKADWRGFVDSMIEDLVRWAIRQAVLAPILNGLGSMFGGGGSGMAFAMAASGHHDGGIAGGTPTFQRIVAPDIFSEARKYHTGGIVPQLRADEVPAILQRGEGVFTAEQMKHLAPTESPRVTVNVINNTSSEVKITERQGSNGEVKIIAQIDEAMAYAATRPTSQFSQAMGSKGTKRMR